MTPAVRQLPAMMGDVPALALGRRSDVPAWNSAGHALFAGHLDPAAPDRPEQRPNRSPSRAAMALLVHSTQGTAGADPVREPVPCE
ncbi:hypothetical protein ACRAKI_10040 [Saccharothrix isguenensis]